MFGPEVLLDRVAELIDHWRYAGDLMPLVSEMDAIPGRSRFAPAASGAETAQTANRLSNDNAGSERVSRAPPGEFVYPHDDQRGDHRRDESAVIDSART